MDRLKTHSRRLASRMMPDKDNKTSLVLTNFKTHVKHARKHAKQKGKVVVQELKEKLHLKAPDSSAKKFSKLSRAANASDISNEESSSDPASTTLIEIQGDSDHHSSQPESARTEHVEGVDCRPIMRDAPVLEADGEAGKASAPTDSPVVSHNEEILEKVSSHDNPNLLLAEEKGASTTLRINSDVVQDSSDIVEATANAEDVASSEVDKNIVVGEVSDLGSNGLATGADVRGADDECGVRTTEEVIESDINSETSGLWIDKAFIDSNWEAVAKGSSMAKGAETPKHPTLDGNLDSPDWQPLEILNPIEAKEELPHLTEISSVAQGKLPADSQCLAPPGLSTDEATRHRQLEGCVGLVSSHNHAAKQTRHNSLGDTTATYAKGTQQSGPPGNWSNDLASYASSDYSPADVHQGNASTQRSKIITNAFINLEEISQYCRDLEDQLQKKNAEANLFKTGFYNREAEYLASKQLASDAVKENADLREELGRSKTKRLEWEVKYWTLADTHMPSGFETEELITRLQDETKSRVKEAENAETELQEAKRRHIHEIAEKDRAIEHHQQVAKLKRKQLNRMMCQYDDEVAWKNTCMRACLSKVGNVDWHAQITEMLHDLNREAVDWRSHWYDAADAHIATQDELSQAKAENYALNDLCGTYEARERQYEMELQEAANKHSALDIERNREKHEYQSELTSCKEHAENLSKENERLQSMLEQMMQENHEEHFLGWYATAKRNNDQLAAINAKQEEKIQKLKYKLLLWERVFSLGKETPILYEPDVEVWKRRAERAEGICAKMDPNPLLDERKRG